MSLCAMCGLTLVGDRELCSHHDYPAEGEAASNRIMCDFFHRGEVADRLSKRDRDEFWEGTPDPGCF